MYQAVQVARRLFDCFSHVIFAVEIEDVRNEVESVLVVVDLRLKPSEVEAIGEIFFIYLAEVFIAPRRYELKHEHQRGSSSSVRLGPVS